MLTFLQILVADAALLFGGSQVHAGLRLVQLVRGRQLGLFVFLGQTGTGGVVQLWNTRRLDVLSQLLFKRGLAELVPMVKVSDQCPQLIARLQDQLENFRYLHALCLCEGDAGDRFQAEVFIHFFKRIERMLEALLELDSDIVETLIKHLKVIELLLRVLGQSDLQ